MPILPNVIQPANVKLSSAGQQPGEKNLDVKNAGEFKDLISQASANDAGTAKLDLSAVLKEEKETQDQQALQLAMQNQAQNSMPIQASPAVALSKNLSDLTAENAKNGVSNEVAAGKNAATGATAKNSAALQAALKESAVLEQNQKALNQALVKGVDQNAVKNLNAKANSVNQAANQNANQVNNLTNSATAAVASAQHYFSPGALSGIQAQAVSAPAAQQLNGVNISELGLNHADLSVDYSGDAGENNSFIDENKTAKLPASKLSTSDYLNLREISQAKAQAVSSHDPISAMNSFEMKNQTLGSGLGSQFGAGALKGAADSRDEKKLRTSDLSNLETSGQVLSMKNGFEQHSRVVDAPVTQGTANKTILSHDALNQITHSVNQMSQAKQDGEIKIRLKPDHLGELQMSVRTHGQQVSIQIKAKDGEAKRIIEESLSSLRDSLSNQKLNLSSIEVVTPNRNTQSADSMTSFDARQNTDLSNGQSQNRGQDALDQRDGRDQSANRQERLFEENARRSSMNRVIPKAYSQNSTRLDMTA